MNASCCGKQKAGLWSGKELHHVEVRVVWGGLWGTSLVSRQSALICLVCRGSTAVFPDSPWPSPPEEEGPWGIETLPYLFCLSFWNLLELSSFRAEILNLLLCLSMFRVCKPVLKIKLELNED